MDAGADLVFTHGDYCAPNVLLQLPAPLAQPDGAEPGVPDEPTLTGVVDWGYAGVADRWRDLVKARWSVGFNYGEEWDARWLDWYGLRPEEVDAAQGKAAFYNSLAEFS